ncbi:MAG: hypothetical protein V4632_01850 [Pseudomonadota bacterium]
MKLFLKKFSIALLLILSATSAFADRGQDRYYRDNGNDSRQQRNNEPRQQERSRESYQGDNSQNSAQDGGRRSGRLSPDERRALRRQINEAGQDIYVPRR